MRRVRPGVGLLLVIAAFAGAAAGCSSGATGSAGLPRASMRPSATGPSRPARRSPSRRRRGRPSRPGPSTRPSPIPRARDRRHVARDVGAPDLAIVADGPRGARGTGEWGRRLGRRRAGVKDTVELEHAQIAAAQAGDPVAFAATTARLQASHLKFLVDTKAAGVTPAGTSSDPPLGTTGRRRPTMRPERPTRRSPTDAPRRRPRPPICSTTHSSGAAHLEGDRLVIDDEAAFRDDGHPRPRLDRGVRHGRGRRPRPRSGSSGRRARRSAPHQREHPGAVHGPRPAARSTGSRSRRSTCAPRPSTWPGRSSRRPQAADVGAVILEIARSEQTYTFQRPIDFATARPGRGDRGRLARAGLPPGRPLPVQREEVRGRPRGDDRGDPARLPARASTPATATSTSTARRSSTSRSPTVDEQQRENYVRAAELTALIRSLETDGVTVSVGGEIGEVGKENSNGRGAASPTSTATGASSTARAPGAIGDQQGQRPDRHVATAACRCPDGGVAEVKLDFEVLRELGEVARSYGLAGAVQHGASTLPDELFHRFPAVETAEIHLATGLPERALRAPGVPGRRSTARSRRGCCANAADERKPDQTDEQFVYTTRKKAIGPFKRQLWDLADEGRDPRRPAPQDRRSCSPSSA